MQAHVSGDLGYVVSIEQGELKSADGDSIKVTRRATNIFHYENERWKLVHRHVDPTPTPQEAAAQLKH